MSFKSMLIGVVMAVCVLGLHAGQAVTFLLDGNVFNGNLVDMSSRTGMLQYADGNQIQKSRVWMINFVSGDWNFPQERQQLASNRDTIFLRDGGVLQCLITDFSSRRRIFEFRDGGNVHESQVMRIYFCCTKLPAAFANQSGQKNQGSAQDLQTVTFVVNGDPIDAPLKYLNSRKTGFTDGLQINTKDIWLINFQDDRSNFPKDMSRIDSESDTIFLVDGQVLVDKVIDFTLERRTFSFENTEDIPYNQIKRIYFCCNKVPGMDQGNRFDNMKKPGKKRININDEE